jgi:hypothetical protein
MNLKNDWKLHRQDYRLEPNKIGKMWTHGRSKMYLDLVYELLRMLNTKTHL